MSGTPYHRLQQYALAISVVSVLYNSAEGAVSIAFGAEASSRALVFFGIQSAIEVVSALIVLWRFRKVAKPGEERRIGVDAKDLRVEKIGTYSIGVLIAILALAAEASAIAALVQHTEPDSSNASLIISASALVCMVLLWLPKRWLAKALDSSTMAGEATCSLSCIQITLVLFVGALVFRLWHGGWWVDSATTIALGLLFAREAYKMLVWVSSEDFDGGCCGNCSKHPVETRSVSATVLGMGLGRAWMAKFVPGVGKKNMGVDVDVKLELGESYRDLCACCLEKDACRESGMCKCDTGSLSTESESCCVPLTPTGEKCCSHGMIKGIRSAPVPVVAVLSSTATGERSPRSPPPTYDAACAKGCCGTNTTASNIIAVVPAETKKVDTCCAGPTTAAVENVKRDACCSGDPMKEDGCCSPKPVKDAEVDTCCSRKAEPAKKVDACCTSSDSKGSGACGSRTYEFEVVEQSTKEGKDDGCTCCK